MAQKFTHTLPMEIVNAAGRITVEDEMLYDLLYNQPEITWMVDPSAAGLWYNKAFYDYTGKTPDYMKNWAWQDFLPVEEIPRVAGSLYHSLSTGEKWECVYPCATGAARIANTWSRVRRFTTAVAQ